MTTNLYMKPLSLYRSFSVFTKACQPSLKLNNINKINFQYGRATPTPHIIKIKLPKNFSEQYRDIFKRFIDKEYRHALINTPKSKLLGSEDLTGESFDDFFVSQRSMTLIDHDPQDIARTRSQQEFDEFVEVLFHYKFILLSTENVSGLIKLMKLTNHQLSMYQVNYIIKNIIKAGRFHEIDEILEELQHYSKFKIEKVANVVGRRHKTFNEFLKVLFEYDGTDIAVKLELLDNLIKAYYEMRDYLCLKLLFKLRIHYLKDIPLNNELMYIKLSWRLLSGYNPKVIPFICNQFVKHENVKYEKMEKATYYKLLEEILGYGNIDIISSFLKIYQEQFNTLEDPLTLLMLGRFKSYYLEPKLTTRLYCHYAARFNLYLGEYNLDNQYGDYGKLIHLVDKQPDMSFLLKHKKFTKLKEKQIHTSPVTSYFVEQLLKMNSKKLDNQLKLFDFFIITRMKIRNLDNTEDLDFQYYRLLLARDMMNLEYFEEELLEQTSSAVVEHLYLFADTYITFDRGRSDKLLVILAENSKARFKRFENDISPKLLSFNKGLSFYKLLVKKEHFVYASDAHFHRHDFHETLKLHYEDKLMVCRQVVKLWDYGVGEFHRKKLESHSYKLEANLPEVLDIRNMFTNPFFYNDLSKESLYKSISIYNNFRLDVYEYDIAEHNEFLELKKGFQNTLPIELEFDEFSYPIKSYNYRRRKTEKESVELDSFMKYGKYEKLKKRILLDARLKKEHSKISFEFNRNDECLLLFTEHLDDIEQVAKSIVPGVDLFAKNDYYKFQFQLFMEKTMLLMAYESYVTAYLQIAKLYLRGYFANFMSDEDDALFDFPGRRMDNPIRQKQSAILNMFKLGGDHLVIHESVVKKLLILSESDAAKNESQTGKVIISQHMVYDLPYKNTKYNHDDFIATRNFMTFFKEKYELAHVYWALRTLYEMKRVDDYLFVKLTHKDRALIADLANINENLMSTLEI